MIKLPGMTLLSILLTFVFALSSVLPEIASANPVPTAAKVSRKSSRKKRSRRSKCSPAARAAGKRQAIDLIRTQSPEMCRLTGIKMAPGDSIINTAEILHNDGELADAQAGDNLPYEEGEIIAELEQEDDVTPDLEAFRTLWLSMIDEKDGATQQGVLPKQKLADIVMEWLGTRYHFGGMARSGIDCSAFTQMLFASALNVTLPRTSVAQATLGQSVGRRSDLQFGDLVFFHTRSRRGISHVGMYLGDNLFAHSSSRYGVTISSLESTYYSKRLVAARRIGEDDIARLAGSAQTSNVN
ncbi:MAG: C40 family peptidase [Candidatus Kapaibacterium sp.]